jgi:hypothetical protein
MAPGYRAPAALPGVVPKQSYQVALPTRIKKFGTYQKIFLGGTLMILVSKILNFILPNVAYRSIFLLKNIVLGRDRHWFSEIVFSMGFSYRNWFKNKIYDRKNHVVKKTASKMDFSMKK